MDLSSLRGKIASAESHSSVSESDFLMVFKAIAGVTRLSSKAKKEKLIEYRFKWNDESKEWLGNKDSIYDQLKRNYHIDAKFYPDFDTLLRKMSSMRVDSTVKSVPGKKSSTLLYLNNPYVSSNSDESDSSDKVTSGNTRAKHSNHRYTLEEDLLIWSKSSSDEELAVKIGVPVYKLRKHRSWLASSLKIRTEEDIRKYYLTKGVANFNVDESHAEPDANTESNSSEQLNEKTSDVHTNREEGATTNRINGLVNRTMDLMADFETLAKEIEGKNEQLRTKCRYEQLLKTLISKDLQFFALTSGDNKVNAQDTYLKSIGFTDKEIKHFRS